MINENINEENPIVLSLLRAANTTSELELKGIKVNSVRINRTNPTLECDYSRACNSLTSGSQIRKYERGQIWIKKVSVMNRCLVTWWQPKEVSA